LLYQLSYIGPAMRRDHMRVRFVFQARRTISEITMIDWCQLRRTVREHRYEFTFNGTSWFMFIHLAVRFRMITVPPAVLKLLL
jgi:hypothetical protein